MTKTSNSLVRILAALATALVASGAVAQPQCSPWTPAYGGGAEIQGTHTIGAGVYWDPDASGPLPPSLIIAGDFSIIGGVPMSHVALWDGANWSPLGTLPFRRNDPLQLLVWDHDSDPVTPDVPLALSRNKVYAYTGGDWVNLIAQLGVAQGVLSEPFITTNIVLHDPDGNGPLGPCPIISLQATMIPELSPPGVPTFYAFGYINGSWTRFGGIRSASFLVSLDRDGDGPEPAVLYASTGINMYRLDGDDWIPTPRPLDGSFAGLRVFDLDGPGPDTPKIVGFGNLRINPLPAPTNSVASFDGDAWQSMGSLDANRVYDMATFDPDGPGPMPQRLVLSGFFSSSDSFTGLAEWDGTEWQPYGEPASFRSASGAGAALDLVSPPLTDAALPLFTLGAFTQAGDARALNIATWDGDRCSSIVSGIRVLPNEGVMGLAWFDPDGQGPVPTTLIACGSTMIASGSVSKCIAYWHEGRWHELGGGVSNGSGITYVRRMLTWDPDGDGPEPAELVIAGLFNQAGAVAATGIARWNGTEWLSLGQGVNSACESITLWDPDDDGPERPRLVVAGQFTTAGGVDSNGIAAWDGLQWSPIGPVAGGTLQGPTRRVTACLWDPDGPSGQPAEILAAGNFTTIGNVNANAVARWDGVAWQPLGTGFTDSVFNIWAFDPDGPGPIGYSAFVTGAFRNLGGNPYVMIMRWDATQWRTIGSNLSEPPDAMTVYDADGTGPQPPRLVIAGRFVTAGTRAIGRLGTFDGNDFVSFGESTGRSLALITDPSAPPDAPRLILGGEFASIDGRTYSGIAQTTQPFERFYAVADRSRVCPGDQAAIEVAFESGATYRWYRGGVSPVAINDGAQAGSSSVVSGALTHRMEIAEVDASFAGEFYCVVTPPLCGVVTTNRALLIVAQPGDRVCLGCGECISDYDQDGGVSGGDIAAFFVDFEAGAECADVDGNGGVDGGDIGFFFQIFEAGGC